MAANPYQQHAATTASPAQLVLMLFDGALTAIGRARSAEHLDTEGSGGLATVNRELKRAQDILSELQVSLDHEHGGAVAGSLDGLYTFCIDRLVQANVRKDLTLLEPVERVVRDLRDAWEIACCRAPVATAAG